jgi:rhodanese-related sulfurtransferase
VTVPAAIRRLTRNQALALAALALGLLTLAGNPYRGSRVTIDTKELATIVGTTVDHVTANELADWIIRGASDYRLIDLRSPEEFARHHIPTAENVPIAQLPDYGLARDEKIVLYSEGGIHSAQAWFLLEAQKYRGAYILFGGLEAWNDEVLYPTAPSSPSPQETAAFERAAQVSRFFGGSPRAAADTSGSAGAPLLAAPLPTAAVAAPAPPAGAGMPRKKAKKEGC